MLEILKIVELIVGILLVFMILIQNKNVALNLSSMSGGMGPVTKRGPEKIMHNITIVLGVLFVINSIALFLINA